MPKSHIPSLLPSDVLGFCSRRFLLKGFFVLGMSFTAFAVAQGIDRSLSGPVIERLRNTGEIVLAHRESSVPFSFLDPKGNPVGYSVDICRRIAIAVAQRLNIYSLRVLYLQVSPSSRIEAIEQGKAVLECGSTTNNSERRKRVAFTIPHFITGARMLVRADSHTDQLDHPGVSRVVSTSNTTPLTVLRQYARQHGGRFQILEAGDHSSAVQMVERGQVDAFVMDDVLLYGLASTMNDRNALKVVGKFLTTEPLAIMLPKNDPTFKKLVDDAMRRMIFSGELRTIYQTWFEKPILQSGVSLNLPPNYLLRDLWKYPTDKVPG